MADEKPNPNGIVQVRVIDLGGYNPGIVTTLRADYAERMAKEKKVIIIGEEKQADKLAPAVNKKGGK